MKVDLSNVLKSTNTALEKQATDTFGSYVEDFARGALGIPKPTSGPIRLRPDQQPKPGTWNASSYAAVLAGASPLRPKLKFLFKVQFVFNDAVLRQFPGEIARQLQENRFTFMIKAVDRPKVDFEYEDDVNMYNYRTKVLKKIRHRELTVTFMDDVGNNVFDFFRILMMIYSPITRDSIKRDGNVSAFPSYNRFTNGNGMEFSNVGDFKQDDVAHRGVINGTPAGNPIDLIRVKQIFIDPTTTPGNSSSAVKAIFYDFVNPRLVSFDLDDLSHEMSDPNLLTMQFDYDWLEMTKHDKLLDSGDGGPNQTVTIAQETREDGGTTGIPRDVLLGANPQEKTPRSTPANGGQGDGNPFLKILAGGASRATQKLTSDLVNKGVKQIVGNGKFANSAIGRTITGAAGTAVSSVVPGIGAVVAGNLKGLTGAGIRDSLGGLFSTTNQSTSRTTNPVLRDSTTAGEDAPLTVRRSIDGD